MQDQESNLLENGEDNSTSSPAHHHVPFIGLGKRKRKWIKKFRKGEGPLEDEMNQIVDNLVAQHQEEHPKKKIKPLVLIYERKARKKK